MNLIVGKYIRHTHKRSNQQPRQKFLETECEILAFSNYGTLLKHLYFHLTNKQWETNDAKKKHKQHTQTFAHKEATIIPSFTPKKRKNSYHKNNYKQLSKSIYKTLYHIS